MIFNEKGRGGVVKGKRRTGWRDKVFRGCPSGTKVPRETGKNSKSLLGKLIKRFWKRALLKLGTRRIDGPMLNPPHGKKRGVRTLLHWQCGNLFG